MCGRGTATAAEADAYPPAVAPFLAGGAATEMMDRIRAVNDIQQNFHNFIVVPG